MQTMSKRRDLNETAARVVAQAVGDIAKDEPADPSAVESGRKGGEARARNLTAEQRAEIARKAARARWRNR